MMNNILKYNNKIFKYKKNIKKINRALYSEHLLMLTAAEWTSASAALKETEVVRCHMTSLALITVILLLLIPEEREEMHEWTHLLVVSHTQDKVGAGGLRAEQLEGGWCANGERETAKDREGGLEHD